MTTRILWTALLMLSSVSACKPTEHMMNRQNIDWQSLEFTCVKAQTPPLDKEADEWFLTARILQKKDEYRHAEEIARLYKIAAERGHYKAIRNLAGLYVDGVGVEQDEREAVRLTERLIEMGVSDGYYNMGVFLQDGTGVKQDRKAGLTYFRKAADMGNPHAQLVIGKKLMAIDDQELRPKVLPIAEAMLHCALSQDIAAAGYELGGYYAINKKDFANSLKAYQAAAKLGHAMSFYTLKEVFRNGKYGQDKDEQRAACYARLEGEADEDNTKKFPTLDRICPLPPKPMPKA
ncbi:MAG TPA: tetratricopeptide repeat protein [Azonexus sp.]|nr:tetratricopeptide repeat protein [Azonexus sp.]